MTIHLISTLPKDNWPKIWNTCYEVWKTSPHSIKLWSKEDLIKEAIEDDIEFYNEYLKNLDEIYLIDYVRYIILQKYGGSYFDLDVEVIDGSFLNKLNPNKIYIMQGTAGAYLENSLMITPEDLQFSHHWEGIKMSCKYKIMQYIKSCLNNNVIYFVGPHALSEYFLKNQSQNIHEDYDLLGYEQFGSDTNSLAYTRHHRTTTWLKMDTWK